MARTIDIRNTEQQVPVTSIRFADDNHEIYVANMLERYNATSIVICDAGSSRQLRITGADHARNMIKALEKAIELGMVL
ncbi:hypothetical protein uav_081 [Pseudomonas phage UAVern]|uniref:Uncharacterized protein n=1 Tax=Pseudomonas phage UAVern TaxID=2856997 RepID=A0A975YYM2_9CAUD|nr:hypothetical protein uav_081 [Pseudomonas phage UAVern]